MTPDSSANPDLQCASLSTLCTRQKGFHWIHGTVSFLLVHLPTYNAKSKRAYSQRLDRAAGEQVVVHALTGQRRVARQQRFKNHPVFLQ